VVDTEVLAGEALAAGIYGDIYAVAVRQDLIDVIEDFCSPSFVACLGREIIERQRSREVDLTGLGDALLDPCRWVEVWICMNRAHEVWIVEVVAWLIETTILDSEWLLLRRSISL